MVNPPFVPAGFDRRAFLTGMAAWAGGPAIAAPVRRVEQEPRFQARFGKWVDPGDEAWVGLRDGRLTVETTAVPLESRHPAEVRTFPRTERKVAGDWTATVVLRPSAPDLTARPKSRIGEPRYGCGLYVRTAEGFMCRLGVYHLYETGGAWTSDAWIAQDGPQDQVTSGQRGRNDFNERLVARLLSEGIRLNFARNKDLIGVTLLDEKKAPVSFRWTKFANGPREQFVGLYVDNSTGDRRTVGFDEFDLCPAGN